MIQPADKAEPFTLRMPVDRRGLDDARQPPNARGAYPTLQLKVKGGERADDVDMRAPRAANRRSQYKLWISPIPAHAPLMAAIIGFGMLSA